MRIQLERFLALSTALASVAAIAIGCTTETVDTPTDDGGIAGGGGTGATGGAAGAGGGAAGTTSGGAGGEGATGGSGGAGGAAGGAGGAAGGAGGAGGACLGGTDASLNDATRCDNLSYAGTDCSGDPPWGEIYCDYYAANGRPEVFDHITTCLEGLTPSDPCNSDHLDAASTCILIAADQACQYTDPVDDGNGGTVDPCVEVAASCSNLTEDQCNDTLNSFVPAGRQAIYDCYDSSASNCFQSFQDCAGSL